MKALTLAVFSTERRIAAVALFRGTSLQEVRTRRLPFEIRRAAVAYRRLVTQTLEANQPEFVAITVPSSKAGERVRMFYSFARELTQDSSIPFVEVEDVTLLKAYGHPPLKRKEHVRRIARTIWPVVNESKSKGAVVDALACGLYVQVERLFSLYEEAP